MSHTRMLQVWFGVLGLAAGVVVLFSGIVTSEKVEASDKGISITVAQAK
jgi:hypothetical protein